MIQKLLVFLLGICMAYGAIGQGDCFSPIVHEKDPATMRQAELQEYFQKLHDAQQELVGCEAPNFIATTMGGTSIELHDLRGKIVVLNFWFIACPPCRAEMPGLKQVADEFGEREDVVLLALATDEKAALDRFLKKHDIGFEVIPAARDISTDFHITGFPTTMVLDKEGKVFSVHIGGSTKEKQASRLFYKGVKSDIGKNS